MRQGNRMDMCACHGLEQGGAYRRNVTANPNLSHVSLSLLGGRSEMAHRSGRGHHHGIHRVHRRLAHQSAGLSAHQLLALPAHPPRRQVCQEFHSPVVRRSRPPPALTPAAHSLRSDGDAAAFFSYVAVALGMAAVAGKASLPTLHEVSKIGRVPPFDRTDNFGATPLAGLICSFVEPLAAGSGIPEIKTYLNGVHIPRAFATHVSSALVRHVCGRGGGRET